MPAQKKFKLGNLKNYAIVAVAAFSVMGTPSKLQAQNKVKPEIENFDLKKASERDKALYNAITNVLEIKYSEEEAASKAGQIMSQTSEFSQEQANNYIRFTVEKLMGDEYREAMEKAKREVDGNIETREPEKAKEGQGGQKTVTRNKFGKEEKTVVEGGNKVTTTIVEEKVFRIGDLTPAERADFNKMLNKIKVAYELRGKINKNLINMQAQHNAQAAFMSSSREKLFEAAVRGIKFRDIDDKSFAAFNPKTGEGRIFAPRDEMSRVQKQVEKAGGIETFVMEVQKKKTNTGETKGNIPLISLDGNIR